MKLFTNKKVLLCEHKMHIPYHVASPWRVGGTILAGGTYLGWGVPTLAGG